MQNHWARLEHSAVSEKYQEADSTVISAQEKSETDASFSVIFHQNMPNCVDWDLMLPDSCSFQKNTFRKSMPSLLNAHLTFVLSFTAVHLR